MSFPQVLENYLEEFEKLKVFTIVHNKKKAEEEAEKNKEQNEDAKQKTTEQPKTGKSKKEDKGIVFSESTDTGMIVTIKGTLKLAEYLFMQGYEFFMTCRLNQDSLEVHWHL